MLFIGGLLPLYREGSRSSTGSGNHTHRHPHSTTLICQETLSNNPRDTWLKTAGSDGSMELPETDELMIIICSEVVFDNLTAIIKDVFKTNSTWDWAETRSRLVACGVDTWVALLKIKKMSQEIS